MNSEMRAAIITRIAIKRGDISAEVSHSSCSESFTFTYSVFLKVFPSSSLNSITIGMLTSPFSVFSAVVEDALEGHWRSVGGGVGEDADIKFKAAEVVRVERADEVGWVWICGGKAIALANSHNNALRC
ncbi:MAG: hypothetical protein MW690_000612 [Methanophagales archaeon]|nr:hypothetical protein [Methanophagales archaeon]